MKNIFLIILAGLVLVSTNAVAGTLDFEDLDPGYEYSGPLPSSYAGFTWNSNTYYVTKNDLPGTGYERGVIGRVGIYTAWENDISMFKSGYFDFNSLYMTSAWSDTQDVNIEGYRDASLVYTSTVTVNDQAPEFITLDWDNVDTVWFRPQTGIGQIGKGGFGDHIVLDNLTYDEPFGNDEVPEPASMALLGMGLLGALGLRRKRN